MEGPPSSKRATSVGCDDGWGTIRHGIRVDDQRKYQRILGEQSWCGSAGACKPFIGSSLLLFANSCAITVASGCR